MEFAPRWLSAGRPPAWTMPYGAVSFSSTQVDDWPQATRSVARIPFAGRPVRRPPLRLRPPGLECVLMNTITLWDEMTSTLGKPRLAFTLAVAETHLTLRELIGRRVTQEVQAYNAQQTEYFQGLVQPTGAELTLNGYRLRQPRQLDLERQVQTALAAFEI